MREFLREKAGNLVRKAQGKEVFDNKLIDGLADDIYGVDSFDEDLNRRQGRLDILNYFDDLELREDLLTNKKILDIGSSNSFFDEYCRIKFNSEVFCVDLDEGGIGKNHGLPVVGDARSLPFKDDCFDLVISHAAIPNLFAPYRNHKTGEVIPIEEEVEEHALQDILQALEEAYRVAKKGGQVRMSAFSESQIAEMVLADKDNRYEILENGEEKILFIPEDSKQKFDRVYLIKKALELFEHQSGAKCIFKDKKSGGLIIIMK